MCPYPRQVVLHSTWLADNHVVEYIDHPYFCTQRCEKATNHDNVCVVSSLRLQFSLSLVVRTANGLHLVETQQLQPNMNFKKIKW